MNTPVQKPASGVLATLLALGLVLGTLGIGSQQPAFSQNKYSLGAFYNITREEPLVRALTLMAESSAQSSLDIIVTRSVRVMFKDLRELDKRLGNYDALSYLGANGQLVIYVNFKHRKAPAEALAAIISHEALHYDAKNSVKEEIAGWSMEARTWREMKQKNPQLAMIMPGEDSLVDRLNTIEAKSKTGELPEFVRARPGYQGLPETSPGF